MRAAAGEQRDQRLALRVGPRPGLEQGEPIEHGVADELGVDAVAGEVGALERQDGDRVIDHAREELGAPRRPGPELGTDVVDRGELAPVRECRQVEIEARIVDQDHRVGAGVLEVGGGAREQADEPGEPLQHARQPHHRAVRERLEHLAAGGLHRAAAQPREACVRVASAHRADQIGRVVITRHVASGQEQMHHALGASAKR
ncbi:MAG: hypothetical protein U1E76_12820 [Planctomycetota bacterium]